MTKRIVAILLTAAIAAATITACGKTAESPETTSVTVEETETKTETETVQETTVEETKYSSSYSKDSYSSSTEKVTCSMCNGTGLVKYYYGSSALEAAMDGHDDYEYGKCTSCDGTGYTYIKTSGSSGYGKKTCPSCGKKVSRLITKEDDVGVNRTWCSECWYDYEH